MFAMLGTRTAPLVPGGSWLLGLAAGQEEQAWGVVSYDSLARTGWGSLCSL